MTLLKHNINDLNLLSNKISARCESHRFVVAASDAVELGLVDVVEDVSDVAYG